MLFGHLLYSRDQFLTFAGTLEEVGDMNLNEKHISLKKNLSMGPCLVYMICFNLNHAGLKLDFAVNMKNRSALMVSSKSLIEFSNHIIKCK